MGLLERMGKAPKQNKSAQYVRQQVQADVQAGRLDKWQQANFERRLRQQKGR